MAARIWNRDPATGIYHGPHNATIEKVVGGWLLRTPACTKVESVHTSLKRAKATAWRRSPQAPTVEQRVYAGYDDRLTGEPVYKKPNGRPPEWARPATGKLAHHLSEAERLLFDHVYGNKDTGFAPATWTPARLKDMRSRLWRMANAMNKAELSEGERPAPGRKLGKKKGSRARRGRR